jgi:predicted ArsR family transcriptional regulator
MASDTPSKIIEYLRKNKAATAEELSRNLNMTGANVRHHLVLMKGEGRITILGQRKEGKGRPIFVYGLTDRELGTGLRQLVESMLETCIENSRVEDQDTLLDMLAKNLAAKNPVMAGMSASRRLGQVVDRLNELHYQAQWEAGATGARVILGHCPYAEIIERHPELCRMDVFLLAEQTGMKVRQLSKLERGRTGTRRCIFTVE